METTNEQKAPSTFTGMVDVDGEPMAAYSLEFAL